MEINPVQVVVFATASLFLAYVFLKMIFGRSFLGNAHWFIFTLATLAGGIVGFYVLGSSPSGFLAGAVTTAFFAVVLIILFGVMVRSLERTSEETDEPSEPTLEKSAMPPEAKLDANRVVQPRDYPFGPHPPM